MEEKVFGMAEAGIANLLRTTRQNLGYDVNFVANHLRIRMQYIVAIEEGRFEDLPGVTYALGFIRSYATFLGLSGNDAVNMFKTEISKNKNAETTEVNLEQSIEGDIKSFSEIFTNIYFMSGTAIIVLGYITFLIFSNLDKKEANLESENLITPETEVISSDNSAKESFSPPQEIVGDKKALAKNDKIDDKFVENKNPDLVVEAKDSSMSVARVISGELGEKKAVAVDIPVVEKRLEVKNESSANPTNGKKFILGLDTKLADEKSNQNEIAGAVDNSVKNNMGNLNNGAITTVPNVYDLQKDRVPVEYGLSNADSKIVIIAVEESWVQIIDSVNQTEFNKLLYPGDKYHVSNESDLILRTGNMQGLKFKIDGVELPVFKGKVRNVKLNVDDLKSGDLTSVKIDDKNQVVIEED